MPRIRHLCLCLTLALLTTAPLLARDLIQAPPGGGPGITEFPEDASIPFSQPDGDTWLEDREKAAAESFRRCLESGELGGPDKSGRLSEVGGDDVLALAHEGIRELDIAIATNGDIFVALEIYSVEWGLHIYMYRSNDGGDSFAFYYALVSIDPDVHYRSPVITVAEGYEDRFYIAYCFSRPGFDDQIHLAFADLDDNLPEFMTHKVIMDEPGRDFDNPDLATDTVIYDNFYLYVVAEGNEGLGQDIYFARSVDQGDNFESPYPIAGLGFFDRAYNNPRVVWGYDGWVHVAWHYETFTHNFDSGIRYRRCPDYAIGGLASWEPIVAVTSTANGMDEKRPSVSASALDGKVMITYNRLEWFPDPGYYGSHEAGSVMSSDEGATWGAHHSLPTGMFLIKDLMYDSGQNRFVVGGEHYGKSALT